MNDADIKKVLERWPQLAATDLRGGGLHRFTHGDMTTSKTGGVGFLVIGVDPRSGRADLLVSYARSKHLALSPMDCHDKLFDSIDAAMNYALVNGLLV